MRKIKKSLAMLLALTMVLSIASFASADGGSKWTEKRTPDGWNKVVNEGGATLGYSKDSGVTIIEEDGFAFKDMNRNGKLDAYEDWRLDAQTRAADLASQLTGEQIGPMLTHGGWMSFGSEIEGTDLDYVLAGGRAGVTRSSTKAGNATMAVEWTNALQKLCESQDYAIPATISVDPNHIAHIIDQLAISATFDADMAFKAGQMTSKAMRAVGVTMLLGPQIDLIGTPEFARASGTFSDDPALTRDMTDAFVSGLQSTFDEDGNDLGWGSDSVIAIMKHYAGAGAGEGGRNDHNSDAKYDVFPNDNLEQHLIGFFDGAFHLTRSVTGAAAGLMTNYGVTYSEDGRFGDNVAGIYSAYKLNLLKEAGWDGFIVSDWGVIEDGGRIWGMEDHDVVERHATVYELGITQTGGSSDVESPVAAFKLLCEQKGEEEATAIYRGLAEKFFITQIDCGLFENPYIDYDTAQEYGYNSIAFTAEAEAEHAKTIIMLKNEGNLIAPKSDSTEKQTIYIPYIFTPASEGNSSQAGTPASWGPCTDVTVASKYYNVVTDSVGEPTGAPDADGNATYTENDVVRASAEELAACDFAVVAMRAAKQDGGKDENGNMLGGNLQYHGYTPTKAREVSIASDNGENWSWNGNPIGDDSNIADLYMLEYVKSAVSCPVVAVIAAGAPMVMSEVEPLADVILYHFGQDGGEIFGGVWFNADAVWQIISGEVEPYALLPFQMPASMDAVDAQDEDTIRDVECYVDAAGNTYDFAYGLNWSGLIEDARTETYRVAPVTECQYLDFHFANEG